MLASHAERLGHIEGHHVAHGGRGIEGGWVYGDEERWPGAVALHEEAGGVAPELCEEVSDDRARDGERRIEQAIRGANRCDLSRSRVGPRVHVTAVLLRRVPSDVQGRVGFGRVRGVGSVEADVHPPAVLGPIVVPAPQKNREHEGASLERGDHRNTVDPRSGTSMGVYEYDEGATSPQGSATVGPSPPLR